MQDAGPTQAPKKSMRKQTRNVPPKLPPAPDSAPTATRIDADGLAQPMAQLPAPAQLPAHGGMKNEAPMPKSATVPLLAGASAPAPPAAQLDVPLLPPVAPAPEPPAAEDTLEPLPAAVAPEQIDFACGGAGSTTDPTEWWPRAGPRRQKWCAKPAPSWPSARTGSRISAMRPQGGAPAAAALGASGEPGHARASGRGCPERAGQGMGQREDLNCSSAGGTVRGGAPARWRWPQGGARKDRGRGPPESKEH